jgi:hypothetical protein
MTRIDALLARYRRHLALPPRAHLPLSQRVWFLVYPPEDERRLSVRLPEFEIATREAGLSWQRVDLGGAYADWMDSFDPEERDCCLDDPVLIEEYADPGFRDFLCRRVQAAVAGAVPDQAERTVFAVTGLMELYDFIQVSAVVDALDRGFPGVLLVFFPGEREGNTYRFLNARTGWDYLAVPILAEE